MARFDLYRYHYRLGAGIFIQSPGELMLPDPVYYKKKGSRYRSGLVKDL